MHWILVDKSALGRTPWLDTYLGQGHPIALLILSVYVVEVECSAAYARRSVLPGAESSDSLASELRETQRKK